MRQAVRVGRQILLSRIRSQGKTGIQSVAAVSSTNVWVGWRPKTKTLYLPFQTLRYIGMAAHFADLSRFAKGARAPLEPPRGKGLKVQDETRMFWPRGTRRW